MKCFPAASYLHETTISCFSNQAGISPAQLTVPSKGTKSVLLVLWYTNARLSYAHTSYYWSYWAVVTFISSIILTAQLDHRGGTQEICSLPLRQLLLLMYNLKGLGMTCSEQRQCWEQSEVCISAPASLACPLECSTSRIFQCIPSPASSAGEAGAQLCRTELRGWPRGVSAVPKTLLREGKWAQKHCHSQRKAMGNGSVLYLTEDIPKWIKKPNENNRQPALLYSHLHWTGTVHLLSDHPVERHFHSLASFSQLGSQTWAHDSYHFPTTGLEMHLSHSHCFLPSSSVLSTFALQTCTQLCQSCVLWKHPFPCN